LQNPEDVSKALAGAHLVVHCARYGMSGFEQAGGAGCLRHTCKRACVVLNAHRCSRCTSNTKADVHALASFVGAENREFKKIREINIFGEWAAR
jgi:hypothetical protein